MATLTRLKVGQIVYSIETQYMGRTLVRRRVLYEIKIVEIGDRFVRASWNGNAPQKFYSNSIKKWRVTKPKPKGERMGLPTY